MSIRSTARSSSSRGCPGPADPVSFWNELELTDRGDRQLCATTSLNRVSLWQTERSGAAHTTLRWSPADAQLVAKSCTKTTRASRYRHPPVQACIQNEVFICTIL